MRDILQTLTILYYKYRFKIMAYLLFCFLTFYSAFPTQALSQENFLIKGKVTDEYSNPVGYCSIFIKKSGTGTVCNEHGEFTLKVRNLKDTIVAAAIGFSSSEIPLLHVNLSDTIKIRLRKLILTTPEVEIKAGENPAVRVIKNAQEARQKNNKQIESYQCKVYSKSVQRLGEAPKKVMGTKVDLNQMNLWVDDKSKIIYMSESISDYYVGEGGKRKEKMIASKVSGDPKAFSGNSASGSLINLYENTARISAADRPFISPIANDAFAHYRFEWAGTFFDNGKMVNKVKIKPRFKADATYSGYVNIMEDTWKIHSFQLSLGKDAQMEFIDSLTFEQIFVPVTEDIMMPTQSSMEFRFSVLGFKGSGIILQSYSDYTLNPNLMSDFFNDRVREIMDNANQKDSSYWEKIRPMPLTKEEKSDYRRRDSVAEIRKTPQYLDSMDRRANTLKWNFLLTGHSLRNSLKKQEFSFDAPLEALSFNAVNGYVVGMGAGYYREKDRFSSYSINGNLRYGFSNQTAYFWIGVKRSWSGFSKNQLSLRAGRKTNQFNENNPISTAFNTSLALFGETHFMKLTESDFFQTEWKCNPSAGFKVMLNAGFENRRIPQNRVNTTPLLKNRAEFAPNLIWTEEGNLNFGQNVMILTGLKILYSPSTKYSSYPDRRLDLYSNWPEFSFEADVRKVQYPGVPVLDIVRMEAGITKSGNMSRLGTYELSFTAGKQMLDKPVSPSDLRHFNGNQIILCNLGVQDFQLLDYYAYSTSQPFIESHLRINFQGLFLNRIPLLRELMLNELLGANLLSISGRKTYTEYFIGMERLNLSAAVAFNGAQTALRIGIKI